MGNKEGFFASARDAFHSSTTYYLLSFLVVWGSSVAPLRGTTFGFLLSYGFLHWRWPNPNLVWAVLILAFTSKRTKHARFPRIT